MKKTRTKKLIENSTHTSTNRNYKDGVFTTLFNDEEKICELYNALKDTDEYKASDIQIRTLENAPYKLYKDDLAFSVAGRFVILTEHQSTPSANMPIRMLIRMLIYIARVYERLLDKKLIYGSSLFKIPRPELYVFYNGLEEWGDNLTMKLSDAYSGYGEKTSRVGVSEDGVSEDGALKCGVTGCDDIDEFLEVKVKVININPKKHAAILERS